MSVVLLGLRAAWPEAGPPAVLRVRFLRPLLLPDAGCQCVAWREGGVRHAHIVSRGKTCIVASVDEE